MIGGTSDRLAAATAGAPIDDCFLLLATKCTRQDLLTMFIILRLAGLIGQFDRAGRSRQIRPTIFQNCQHQRTKTYPTVCGQLDKVRQGET
jgi:hypothetical protein